MRHNNSGRKLSRTPAHRKALLQILAKPLFKHGRIRPTVNKAKELRRVIEPLVTLTKKNDVASRRLAYRELNDRSIVKRLFDEIGPRFAAVAGGYTRILKLATPRAGDNAPMCVIEFTDYEAQQGKKDTNASASAEAPKAEAAEAAK